MNKKLIRKVIVIICIFILSLTFMAVNDNKTIFVNDKKNVGIGVDNPSYKLEVKGAIMLQQEKKPKASKNKAGIYSDNGQLFALSQNGDTTQLSPHDAETGEWIYFSKNIITGRVLRIEMEELIFDIAEEMSKKTGKIYIKEYVK